MNSIQILKNRRQLNLIILDMNTSSSKFKKILDKELQAIKDAECMFL